jgi:hypothetical protein
MTASPVAKTCIRTHMNCNLQMSLQRVLCTIFCCTTARIGLRPTRFDISRSHSITHTRARQNSSERVIISSQRPTHNIHKRRTSMPSAGFEPAIPAMKRLKTYPWDRMATRIFCSYHISSEIWNLLHLSLLYVLLSITIIVGMSLSRSSLLSSIVYACLCN